MRVRIGSDVHDLYREGDQCAVYAGDEVFVLSPVATLVLAAVQKPVGEGGSGVADLARELERGLGADLDDAAGDVVRDILNELVRLRILRVDDPG